MKTIIHILGSYTGEIILTAFGVVIRKIELTLLRRKALKEKKKAAVGSR
jgi:hypothetical protein